LFFAVVTAWAAICGPIIVRTIITVGPFRTTWAAFALLLTWSALFGFAIILRNGIGVHSIGRTLLVITLRTIIILPIVAVFATVLAGTTFALLFLTRFLAAAEIGEYAEIMVSKLQVYARLYRPRGIFTLERTKTANALLNDWSSDIGTLLTKLEGACHLIHKENMVHKIGA
jgi:hypothetical protein